MKAVFAYKILENFWKPRDDYFFKLAKVSVDYASNLYPTVLYSDKNTFDILKQNNIIFDEFVDCTEFFSIVQANTYALPKVLVMSIINYPYIMLDLDTILFEKINTSHSVTFGYKEVDLSENYPLHTHKKVLEYISIYYEKPFEHFTTFNQKVLKSYDWSVMPSNSLVIVNNPNLVMDLYKKIIKLINGKYEFYTVQFYEQFLFYNFLNEYKADFGFVYDSTPSPEEEKIDKIENIYSFKFLHLDKYFKSNHQKKLIDNLFNELKDKKSI
jgi:hypothetical protein